MSQDDHKIIAEHPSPVARRIFWIVLTCSLTFGGIAAGHYAAIDLTLSHYDARGHLVVARRVIDSLTPGWRQLGAIWLPLPHLLNILPSSWDWAYRTGAIAVAISVTSFSLGLAALARLLVIRTGSVAAALTAPLLALANPNVLYLQATPMTEPLVFGLTFVSIAAVDAWLETPSSARAAQAGGALTALVMTRYEGWIMAGVIGTLAMAISWRRRELLTWFLLWPLIAIVAFLLTGLLTTGQWPTSQSFFVPDPQLFHQPSFIADKVTAGILELAGPVLVCAALAGLAALLTKSLRSPQLLLLMAPLASITLPILAFNTGHPYRVRYLVPLVVAAAVLSAVGLAALPRRLRAAAAVALCAGALWTRYPFDSKSPMLIEAQWETPFRLERQRVTAALLARDDGSPILASMGSLGHYMHEVSASGIPLRRFLHEGTGVLWTDAFRSPRRSVRWVLVEERAEGGDAIAIRAREDASFLEGFERVIEAGGLVLYERKAGSGAPAFRRKDSMTK